MLKQTKPDGKILVRAVGDVQCERMPILLAGHFIDTVRKRKGMQKAKL